MSCNWKKMIWLITKLPRFGTVFKDPVKMIGFDDQSNNLFGLYLAAGKNNSTRKWLQILKLAPFLVSAEIEGEATFVCCNVCGWVRVCCVWEWGREERGGTVSVKVYPSVRIGRCNLWSNVQNALTKALQVISTIKRQSVILCSCMAVEILKSFTLITILRLWLCPVMIRQPLVTIET